MKTHSLRVSDPPVSRGPRHRILSLLALVFIAAAPAFAAQPLNAQDAGTYALLKRDGQPSTMQYRVSLAGGRWIAEGREGAGEWRDISCDQGCRYRDSTPEKAVQFLPARQREEFDIACIQNTAAAFCRYTNRADPAKGGYLMAALVTAQPIPVLLRRVSPPVSAAGYTEDSHTTYTDLGGNVVHQAAWVLIGSSD